ncbi:MAG: ORF6N domain-containing protein [Bacilli bacterium]
MNELIVKDDIKIENMIYEVRGKQVMLDSDLAKLYQVETKRINEAVKNNLQKFPERFSWKLTKEESENFLVENFDQKLETRGGRYKNPRVFTEQGVAMLATILKSKVAIDVSIAIMDAFVAMRKYISSNLLEQKYVNNMVFELDERVSLLENTFSKFDTFSNEIFFEGQIYDSYSLLLDIFSTSNNSIVIIDNYISKELLDILSKTNKQIIIYTKNIDNNLINKYNSQYHNVKVLINNSFHDRFIIIDNKVLYHCGASFKDLGKKCFAINKIDDKEILYSILNIL